MNFEFHLLPHSNTKKETDLWKPEWKPFYQGSSPILTWISKHALYLLSFLIPVILLSAILAYRGFAPFGEKNFFLSDISGNLSFLTTYLEQLHAGNFSFLAQGGNVGEESFSMVLFFLCSPLRLFITFFSGETAISLLTVLVIFQVGFAGFAMSFYLTKRLSGTAFSRYDLSLLIFSLGYALSSYMLVQYNDFMYLDCAVLFPILMLTYEYLFYKQKTAPFIITLFWLFLCNFYITAIVAGLLFLHLLTRQKGDLHQACLCLRRYLGALLKAGLCSAVTVIPGFYSLYRSEFGTSGWDSFGFVTDWFTAFSRFLPADYGSYHATGAYGFNLYCGIFVMVLLCIYPGDKKIPLQERLRNLVYITLLMLFVNVTSLRYVASLFTNTESLFNCFGFVLVFHILSAASESLYHLKDTSRVSGLLGLAVPAVLFILITLYATHYENQFSIMYCLIFFVVYGMLYIFYRINSIGGKAFYALLLFFTIAELLGNTLKTTEYLALDTETVSDSLQAATGTACLKDFTPFTMEELSGDFAPGKGYFVEGSYAPPKEFSSTVFTQQNEIAASLGASKDLFTPANLSIAYEISENITCRQTSSNIFSLHVQPDTLNYEVPYNSIYLEITPDQSGDLYLYAEELVHVGKVTAGEPVLYTMRFPTSAGLVTNYWLQGAYLDTEALSELQKNITLNCENLKRTGLTGWELTVNVPAAGTVLLNLPRTDWITYRIDNEKVLPTETNDGVTAFSLSAGEHVISLRLCYIPFYIGLAVSLAMGILLLLRKKNLYPAHKLCQNISGKLNTACYCMESFCQKHCNALYSFLLPLLFLLTACIISYVAPFGNNTFFKNDGAMLTIPTFYQAREHLGKGSFFYTWTSGGGSNLYYSLPNMFLYYWLCLIPENLLLEWVTIIEIIKIALCGFTCYLYLTRRKVGQRIYRKDCRVLIFTTAYSLSSYMINTRGFFSWVDVLLLLPLILLALEKLMLDKKKSPYIFLLALAITNNYYITLFVCVYLAFTFFTYRFAGVKDFIQKGLRFAFSSIVSAGICFFALYPTYLTRNISPYSSSDSVAPDFKFYQSFWDSLKQFFVFSKPIIVTNNDGAINLYCGIFCLILAVLYIFLAKPCKNKYLKLGFMVFIFFSSNNHVLSYIWNGFHYQSKVPNRYSFLLIFLMLDISCEALYLLKKCSRRKLCGILGGLFVSMVVIRLMAQEPPSAFSTFNTLLLLVVFSLLLIFMRSPQRKGRRSFYNRVILSLALLELCVNTCYSFWSAPYVLNNNIKYNLPASGYLKETYLGDSLIDRVTYFSPLRYNQNMVTHVNSVNQFNSFLTVYQYNWAISMGQAASNNNIYTDKNATPFANALTNTRYVVLSPYTYADTIDLEHYTPVGTYDGSIILENKNALFGFYMPFETYVMTERNGGYGEAFANSFVSSYVPDSLLLTDTIPLRNKDSEGADAVNNYTYTSDDIGTTHYQQIRFTPSKSGEYYYCNQEFAYLGYLEQGREYQFTIDCFEDLPGSVSLYHGDVFDAFYAEASKYPLKVDSYSDTTLDGTITLPEDGFIYLPIPYEQGWHAYIDGEEVPTGKMTDDTLFLVSTKGTHDIHLAFEPVGLTTAVTVSGIFAGIFVLVLIWELLPKRRKKEPVSTENQSS